MTSGSGFEIGVARRELGEPVVGAGMMGWGMWDNWVEGSATPLHARAFFIREGEASAALVCLELTFISTELRRQVVAALRERAPELGLDYGNLLLCATHTHSAPGGLTQYPFYNITIPGFVPDYLEQVVSHTVDAILEAARRAVPGRVRRVEGEFDADSEVAFNRSVDSYNRNRDVEAVTVERCREALDRTMRMLVFEDEAGQRLGAFNLFAVHATNVHSDNREVHFDNKGYAARFMEAAHGPDYVAAFAQGAAGDVTPNFRSYADRPWVRGADPDDDTAARINGRLQFERALELEGSPGELLAASLSFAHTFVDFSDAEVDLDYAEGVPGRRTGPAEIGWAMLFGTEEGPGIDRRLLPTQALGQRLRRVWGGPGPTRREVQGPKLTVIESGRRRVVGLRGFGRFRAAGRLHPALAQFLALDATKGEVPKPWTAQVLPLQLIRLGGLVIAAVPAEFTTVAGRRLRASLAAALEAQGVESVWLCGYANAYGGYVTTPEEYECQDYEGASTLFGTWTLGAYQTHFDRLAAQLGRAPASRGTLRPPRFSAADMKGRIFDPARVRRGA